MHLLPIQSVLIGENRQRREFEETSISDLASSIRANGLLHPIVVRATGNGMNSVTLVAGERRLLAIQALELNGDRYAYGEAEVPIGMVPCNYLGELNEVEAEEAELTENIHRIDLSWQEKVDAINKIVRLKEIQAGTSLRASDVGAEIFPEMTANNAVQATRTAQILQRHMTDPDVAKAKSINDAIKIVRRKEDARVNSILAAEVGVKAASELHSVHHADCREWLGLASPQQFDVVLIDPPYGMGADSFGDAAGKRVGIDHDYEDDADYALGLMKEIAYDLWRVSKDQSHLYIWCDIDLFHDLRALFAGTGWRVFRTPLINIKREGGRVPWPEHGPRRCYELVMYGVKGNKPVTSIERDVFESTLERDTGGHGAAKPVEAYANLLKRSTRPGDSVLDCFAGSGTILAAAHQLKLRATAVEANDAYYGQCVKRLQDLDKDAVAELMA